MPKKLTRAQEYIDPITVRVVGVLKEHGPMTLHAMVYFVNASKEGPYINASSLRYALKRNQDKVIEWSRSEDSLIKFSNKCEEEPRFPSFVFEKDYVRAYYQLLAKVQEYKNHPELLNLPDAWADAILAGNIDS